MPADGRKGRGGEGGEREEGKGERNEEGEEDRNGGVESGGKGIKGRRKRGRKIVIENRVLQGRKIVRKIRER